MKNFKVLSRAEMKNVAGGVLETFTCYALNKDGSYFFPIQMPADNIDQAQAGADYYAWDTEKGKYFPYGIDCPGS